MTRRSGLPLLFPFLLACLLFFLPGESGAEHDAPPEKRELREALWRGYEWLEDFIAGKDVPKCYGGEFMLFHAELVMSSADEKLVKRARRDGRRFALRCLGQLSATNLFDDPEDCHEAMSVLSLLEVFELERWGRKLRQRTERAIAFHGARKLSGMNDIEGKSVGDAYFDPLVAGHFARRGGFTPGEWLPEILDRLSQHPWQARDEVSDDRANDQDNLVTHVIYVLSDYGRLRLDPMRFRPEIDVLLEGIETFIEDEDPEGVAECIDCLRILGWPEEADPLPRGLHSLLRWQRSDGSWCPEGGDEYDHYHATWCVIDALRSYRFQGEGPRWPGWREADS